MELCQRGVILLIFPKYKVKLPIAIFVGCQQIDTKRFVSPM